MALPFRLLLVEDNFDSRVMLAKLLHIHGYDVVTASGTTEAAAACAQTHFDACIADIGLADGDGVELMRELKLKYNLSTIACSGYSDEKEIQTAREAGFVDYLIKPVDLKLMLETIARTLGNIPATSLP